MAWDPNQGQPNTPDSGHGTPSNPYDNPQIPYSSPQQVPPNPYTTPPENPYATPSYGAPNYQAGPVYFSPPPSAPLPLGEAIRGLPNQYIRVVTKPGAMTFAEEMGKASWDIVWVQLIVYAIITAILGFLATLITPFTFGTTNGSGSVNPATLQSVRTFILGVSIGNIVLVPLFFFIGMAIIYWLARAFGGQGRFLNQSYTYLLFDVPLGIVSSLISLIPVAGSILVLAIGVYRVVLAVFALMAVHRLSGGKAAAVVLIPLGVLFLLVCGLLVLGIALLAAAVQHG